MNVGFIGLGHMGGPMCRNLLQAGYPLTVNDLHRTAAKEHESLGAKWASTPAAVAVASDVVITMLPTPRHVEEVLLGQNGLLSSMQDGSMWIDMSTSTPAVANTVIEKIGTRKIAVLDAPVSGMAAGAEGGWLQIFVGGSADDLERARALFNILGNPEKVLHVGNNGTGYTVKLMINALWFAHQQATAEVLMTGVKAGVELDVLRNAIINSPANSNYIENDIACVLDNGDYDETFAMALACKDIGLAVDLAADVGVPVEVCATVAQVSRRVKAQYGPLAGEMCAVRLLEDLTSTPMRSHVGTHTSSPEELEMKVQPA